MLVSKGFPAPPSPEVKIPFPAVCWLVAPRDGSAVAGSRSASLRCR